MFVGVLLRIDVCSFICSLRHGKVKYLNDGSAVLKFESGEKASRALKHLQGSVLWQRKLEVDFNKRPNFVAATSGRHQQSLLFQERQAAVGAGGDYARRSQQKQQLPQQAAGDEGHLFSAAAASSGGRDFKSSVPQVC